MDYIKLTIYTTNEGIAPVSGVLYDMGIYGIEIEDEKEFNEFLENNTKYWDFVEEELVEKMKGETRVIIYMEDDEEFSSKYDTLVSLIDELKEMDETNSFGSLVVTNDSVKDEDWCNNWKKYFHPIEIGEKILVCPQWEDAGETDRIVFKINPGMTFGTGAHHSTSMCIEQLEKCVKKGDSILDVGCGSGILSLISTLLGADHVTALDIDENCVHVVYENAELNNIDKEKMKVLSGDILSDDKLMEDISGKEYDIIVANIVADVIMPLAPKVKPLLKEGGYFICSGIITERLDEVRNVLSEVYNILEINTKSDWAMICSKNKNKL